MDNGQVAVVIVAALFSAWPAYQLIRFYRTGEISIVGEYNLAANREDPTLWLGMIIAVDVGWLILGLALTINAIAGL